MDLMRYFTDYRWSTFPSASCLEATAQLLIGKAINERVPNDHLHSTTAADLNILHDFKEKSLMPTRRRTL
jgi:hypothetical protein